MIYSSEQKTVQSKLLKEISTISNGYVLPVDESYKNIYGWENSENVAKIRNYFLDNKIKWWGCEYDLNKENDVTRHMLSSQVACLNHLFFIRQDANAVLSIINGVKGMPVRFKDVLNIECDKGENNFISFEMVGSEDYLNELNLQRGELCTSLDAVVYAVDENDERWIIPIEWKYTETYKRKDLSLGYKGKVRLARYCNIKRDNLIENSKQLVSLKNYKGSIYFQEPFYQLMRQTLLAERICNNKNERITPAEHFVHIHVCPQSNKELLFMQFGNLTNNKGMEDAWRSMLYNQDLYHLVDPKELMEPIKISYPDLYEYLDMRYWQ